MNVAILMGPKLLDPTKQQQLRYRVDKTVEAATREIHEDGVYGKLAWAHPRSGLLISLFVDERPLDIVTNLIDWWTGFAMTLNDAGSRYGDATLQSASIDEHTMLLVIDMNDQEGARYELVWAMRLCGFLDLYGIKDLGYE